MNLKILVMVAITLGFGSAWTAAASTAESARQESPKSWTVWGGKVGLHWNRDLAQALGMRIGAPVARLDAASNRHFERFEVRRKETLDFRLDGNAFRGFSGGSLRARGGYLIELGKGTIDLRDFRLVPRSDDPMLLDVVSADGKAWFFVDRLMYEHVGLKGLLSIRTMDVRISAALARRIGQPAVAGWVIADMDLDSEVLVRGAAARPDGNACDIDNGANCLFDGSPAPDGGTYQVDLFMQNFAPQWSRCQNCTGPAGSGTIVYTPTSTLRNNVNLGGYDATVSGQGVAGISAAKWAADIPWFNKFDGVFPPYGNDQHPFLIWNMYRLNADGSLDQIGRSGLKHAYLTTNLGCADGRSPGHVLGAACSDTYTVSNNDDDTRLGPRSEVIAATNQWGRCGSIYDADCDGINDDPDVFPYDYRLKVGESQISPSMNPGASYWFESWYLARRDINIYNSMGTVVTTQNWNAMSQIWGINATGFKLGPAIDRWVDPLNPASHALNRELSVSEGHAKLAVKARYLGDGNWRYDYVVMNLDFARAAIDPLHASEPNLKVTDNRGFDRFALALPEGATVTATQFSDGDLDAGNDWPAVVSADQVVWSAPASGATLDWGSLYRFSLTVDAEPVSSKGSLHVARSGTPESYDIATLGPAAMLAPQPQIAVTPTPLVLAVAGPGASVNGAVAIANAGPAQTVLHYSIQVAPLSCASPASVPWLTATTAAGWTQASGGPAQVAVTADATALTVGTYSARICVSSDDPAQALLEVPVSFDVGDTIFKDSFDS